MYFTKKNIFLAFTLACVYILVIVYITNASFITTVLLGKFPLLLKIKIFWELISGFPITLPTANFIVILFNAILSGITIILVIERIVQVKKMGNIHIVAGGSWIFAIISGGCISCGLPIFSLFGLSGALLYLPFKGAEVPYISCMLLFFSLVLLIRQKRKDMICEISQKQ